MKPGSEDRRRLQDETFRALVDAFPRYIWVRMSTGRSVNSTMPGLTNRSFFVTKDLKTKIYHPSTKYETFDTTEGAIKRFREIENGIS